MTFDENADTGRDLEATLSAYAGRRYCVCCSSGSAALDLAMAAVRPKSIYLPASTFPAAHESARRLGIERLFADVDDDGQMLAPTHPNAIVAGAWFCPASNLGVAPKWLHSQPPNVINDAAAAILSPDVLRLGHIATVSFNANKAVTGYGGGALLTDDPGVADIATQLKRHGELDGFAPGWNYQMPGPCAEIILRNLARVDEIREQYASLAHAYAFHLQRVGLRAFPRALDVPWATAVIMRSRERRMRAIEGIAEAMDLVCRTAWRACASMPRALEIDICGLFLPGPFYGEADMPRPEQTAEICDIIAESNKDDGC